MRANPGPTPARGKGRRIEGLDAIRGAAVFLVMLRHAVPPVFAGAGIVGVTAFFTLSGYLITGLLVRDLAAGGTVRWGRFYAHRAFRLYPALLLLLAVYAGVELVASPLGERALVAQSVALGITYTSDLPLPWRMSSGLTHLWTLAVEEQFYLLWPLALFLCTRYRVRLQVFAGTAIAVLTLVGLITLGASTRPSDIYERPTTWASAMAIGGLAFVLRHRLEAVTRRSRGWSAGAALFVLAAISVLPDAKELPLTYVLGPAVIGVATVATILTAQQWSSVPSPILRPLVWLGTISYGVYLWNLPVVSWIRAAHVQSAALLLLLSVPATIAAATVSWFTAEAAGRAWRRRFDQRRRPRPGRPLRTEAARPETAPEL